MFQRLNGPGAHIGQVANGGGYHIQHGSFLRFVSFGTCFPAIAKFHQPGTVVPLHDDKHCVNQSGKKGCEQKYREFAEGNGGKKGKEAEQDDHFVHHFGFAHGGDHVVQSVFGQIEGIRIEGGHVLFPCLHVQLFVQPGFPFLLPEPVFSSAEFVWNQIANRQPHQKMIQEGSAGDQQGKQPFGRSQQME